MTDLPERIGRYRVLKHLATGGMGEVFLARQDGLSGFTKVVVIKRLLPQFARDPGFLQMFLNEARYAALLQHPNIAQVFDLGEDRGQYFIAMEYVHGASLRGVKQALTTQGRALLPELGAQLCAQALRGLHHAHSLADEAGKPLALVHRDVSPDNLLVGYDGVVKVVDFGIAKATSGVSTTSTGTVKGKFAYMAPEYLQGDPIDARADVYSLGVVLYELLGGQRPFKASSDPALILSILKDRPVPLTQLNAGVPAPLEAIVTRALEKDPFRRYQSAEQMAQALERIVAGKVTATTVNQLLLALFGEEAARRPSGEVPTVPVPAVTRAAPQLAEVAASINTRTSSKAVSPPSAAPTAESLEFEPEPHEREPPTLGGAEDEGQPRRSSKLALGVAFAVSLAVGVVAVFFWKRGDLAQPERPPPAVVVVAQPDPPQPAPQPAPPAPSPPAQPIAAEPTPAQPTPAQPTPAQPPPVAVVPAPPATQAPVEAKTGKVQLLVLPWAEVRLGTKVLGVTPLDAIELPRGAHTLELRNDELGVVKRVKVMVPAGGVTKVRVDMMQP